MRRWVQLRWVLWALPLAGLLSEGCRPGGREPERARIPASHYGTSSNSPLALRPSGAAASSRPLFEKLDPQRQGIDFQHRWAPRDAYETNLLRTGFTGGGVCLGDYDQDGRCDVFFTRPHGGAKLYKNEGDFRFRDVTRDSGLEEFDSWSTGSVFVDLNNDGWLDLFVCGFLSPNHLYLNQRDGTFREGTIGSGLDQLGANVKMIFADYDGDGDLDAFLVTNRREPRSPPQIKYLGSPGHFTVAAEHQEWVGVLDLPGGEQRFVKAGQRDYLLRNDWVETGALHFTDVTDRSGIRGNYHGLDAIWWDYDQDGHPDLYIGNDFTDPDQLYRNQGDGTFLEVSASRLPRTPWSTMACGAGDFNNDGLPDLFLADMAGTSPQRHMVAMASMEAMGWFLDWANPPQYLRNCLLVNTGRERFLEAAELAGVARSDWTWSAKVGDLDEDGREDIFVSNGFTRDYLDVDFLEAFRRTGAVEGPALWERAPELRERNLAFHNLGALKFENLSREWGVDELGISFGAALGDLDGDGDLDLVVNRFGVPPGLYRNTTATGHRLTIRLQGVVSNPFGVGAEVQLETASGVQLRQLHPGNGYMSADQPLLHFGLGQDSTAKRVSIRWPSGRRQELRQVAADQLLTIVEPDANGGKVPESTPAAPALFISTNILAEVRHTERNFSDFDREPLLPHKLSQLGPGFAWGDVDGDGRADFFLGGAAGQPGQIWRQRAIARFEPLRIPVLAADSESEDMGCLLMDVDGDGDLDLVVVSGGNEGQPGSTTFQDRLYRNEGLGADGQVRWTRATNALPVEVESGGPLCAWDMDRDGDLDLFVGGRMVPGAYPSAPRSFVFENRGGIYVDVTVDRAPELARVGMVTGALASDFDGDGWTDLVITLDHGAVRFFRNAQGQLIDVTAASGVGGMSGLWGGIAAGDLDRDGDIDYVVSNSGRNTQFFADPEHPQVTYLGDLDGSGSTNLVVGRVEGQSEFPVRTRGVMAAVFPFIREKIPTYAAYGRSTLKDLFGPERLAGAHRWLVNTADSGVLVNEGEGRFRFVPFPRETQNAPGFGVAVLHADGDALLDVFLCQNLSTGEREVGKLNGGVSWLLSGRGDATFRPVWPRESGITITGDARAVGVVDLDGQGSLDLVVAVNDATVQSFCSAMPSPTSEVRVVLRGSQANSHAIGARIQMTSLRGIRETREIYSGSENVVPGGTESRFRFDPADGPREVKVWWPRGEIVVRQLGAVEPRVELQEP